MGIYKIRGVQFQLPSRTIPLALNLDRLRSLHSRLSSLLVVEMTTITTTALPTHQDPDLELSPMSPSPTDPYSLQARLIPKEELTTLRQRGFRRKVRKFYEDQNANIERMLKSVDEHRLAADIEHEGNQLKVKIAVRGSFIFNVILAILQTYGATSSLSYSLFATMADSIFDPFSNLTLWLSHRAAKKIDESKYPAVPPYPTIVPPLRFP